MSLNESLSLDINAALSNVDALESRLTDASNTAGAALSAGIADAISAGGQTGVAALQEQFSTLSATVAVTLDSADVDQAVATLGDDAPPLTLTVDTSEIDAAADQLRTLDGELATAPFAIDVDTSQVDAATETIDAIPTSVDVTVDADASSVADAAIPAIESIPTEVQVSLPVDDSGVIEATDAVDQLAESAQNVSRAPLFSGGGDSTGAGLLDTAGSVAALSTGVDGLDGVLGSVSPKLATVAAASAGAGAGLATMFGEAVNAESATIRLNAVLGEQADQFTNLDGSIAGFTGTISDLALATGSSDEGLTVAGANFADLGKQAGLSNTEVAKNSQSLAVLASYIASTRPELGSADEIIGRLGTSLQRGGRFAQQMGLDIGSAGQIADRAATLFDKPKESLTGYEKSVAGLTIAYEQLGDKVGPAIESAANNPQIALRILQTRISEVAEAAGGPLLNPLLDTLEAITPVVEKAVTGLAALADGGITVLASEGQVLLGVLDAVVSVLSNPVVSALLSGAGAAYVFYRSTDLAVSGARSLVEAGRAVASTLSRISSDVGKVDIGSSFSEVAQQLRGVTAAEGVAAAAAANVQTTYDGLQNALAAASSQALVGSESFALITEAQNANAVAALKSAVASEAQVTVLEKEAAVRAAEAAVSEGAVGATTQLVAAKSELVIAEAEATVASQAATAAQSEVVAATIAASATTEGAAAGVGIAANEAAAAVTVLGDAEALVAEETAATSAVMSAANPILLALTVAVGAAFAAYQIFGGGAEKTAEQVGKASDAIEQYGNQLDITGQQLANSSQVDLARRFENDKSAAEDFKTAIKDMVSDDALAKLQSYGLSFERAGAAIRGNVNAAKETRDLFVASGEVSATARPEKGGELDEDLQKKIQDAALRTYSDTGSFDKAEAAGRQVAESYQKGLGADVEVTFDTGRAVRSFEEQAAAQEEATKGLAAQAAAQADAGDATNIASITLLAQEGALDRLTPKQQASARALLDEAAASEQASAADAVLEGMTDRATAALARKAFAAQAAITAGNAPSADQVAAARALAASDGFLNLDQTVQDATNSVLKYADAEIQAAHDAGQLLSSTGELAIGMSELKSQLDSAADAFVNVLSKSQAMGSATRNVNKLLDEVVPTTKKLGTTLDETSASFDTGSITADNYTEYLRLLPKRVQDAIEGRDQAVKSAEKKRQTAADQTDADVTKGQLAARFAAGEFVGGLSASGTDSASDAAEKEAKTAEQKAAETRAAIEKNGDALDTVARQARQNTRDLADFFDELGVAIRQEAAEMLKSGDSIDVVTKKIADRRTEFITQAREAGFTNDKILELLGNERLLPDQVSIDLRETGVDRVVSAIERLGIVLAGLADIDPQVLRNIQGISDPTKQVEEFNNAIAKLPTEQQVKLRALFNVPETEVAAREAKEAAQRSVDSQSAIELSVTAKADLDSALEAGDQIAAVVATIPADVPIKITPDTVDAVAEFDKVTKPKADELVAVINSKADPATKKAAQDELDKIAKSRDALIKALISPESLDRATQELAAWAAQQTLTFQTVVLPPSNVPSSLQGGSPGQRNADSSSAGSGGSGAPSVASTVGGGTGLFSRLTQSGIAASQRPVADRIREDFKDLPFRAYTPDEVAQGLPKQILDAVARNDYNTIAALIRNRNPGPPARFFAAGGTTVDEDEMRRRLASLNTTIGQPGLKSPGDYQYAEPSTQGEWLISRDPQFRQQNQGFVTAAALDLGVRLPAPTAPTLVLDRPTVDQPVIGGDSGLAAAVAGLSAAVTAMAAGNGRPSDASRPGVVIESLTVQAPDPDLRTSRSTIEDVRTAVFTAK